MRKFKAKITFATDNKHPDTNKMERLEFEDVYKINEDYFFGYDHIISHIKNDLMLVAGDGYNTDHIHDIKFDITEI